MKIKSFLLALFLILTYFCFSQAPANGDVRLNPYLDKYVGTWKFVHGDTNIIVRFKKIMYSYHPNPNFSFSQEELMGGYTYKLNGVIIEDNLTNFAAMGQNLQGSLSGWTYLDGSEQNNTIGIIVDSLKNKSCNLRLKFISGQPQKIEWQASNRERIVVVIPGHPAPFYDNTFTLPSSMTLIKQP